MLRSAGTWALLGLTTVAIAPSLGCKKSVGELKTYDVVADAPGDPLHPAEVHVEVQAGDLHLTPGGVHVVGGAAKTNVGDLAPVTATSGYKVTVTQGKSGVEASKWESGLIADFRLTLGTTPMALSVTGGAASSDLELGGLAVQSLTVRTDAGPVRVGFNAPNPVSAETLDVETGAGPVFLSDVGHFGASKVRVRSGVGPVNVSLGNKVDREVSLDLETAAGPVKVSLPAGITARADVKSEAGPLKLSGWTKDGEEYVLGASVTSPRVHIHVKTGAGPITFENSP